MLKINKINTILIYIFIILFFMANISDYFFKAYDSIIFIILNFGILFILAIINYNEINKDIKKNYLIIMTLTVSIITSMINLSGFGSVINLANFILGLCIFSSIKFNKQGIILINLMTVVCFISKIISSKSIWNNYINGTNIMNPNSVAFCILCCTIILFSSFEFKKNGGNTILKLVIMTFAIIGIYWCNSRGSLVALLIFALIQYIPKLEKFIYKNKKKMLLLIIIIGSIFPIIYVNLYFNNIEFTIPFSDKSLYTGREVLWFNMINSLENNQLNFLTGVGSNFVTNIGIISNFHNWYIGVIYTFGIIEYIFYFITVIYVIAKIKNKKIISGIIALFVLGFFESVALYFIAQIFFIIFLIIGNFISEKGE